MCALYDHRLHGINQVSIATLNIHTYIIMESPVSRKHTKPAAAASAAVSAKAFKKPIEGKKTDVNKNRAAAAPRWTPGELDAVYARLVEAPAAAEGRGGGALGLLGRLADAYAEADAEAYGGDPWERLAQGIERDIETCCRLANTAVLMSGKGEGEGEEGAPTDDDRARLRAALSALYYASQAVCASTVACRTIASAAAGGGEGGGATDDDLAAGIARFSAPDPEETNRVQQLLLYLLNTVQVTFSLLDGIAREAGRYATCPSRSRREAKA